MSEPIDAATMAVMRSDGGAVGAALPPEQIRVPITAAQAKIEAVANLTMKAYERAATLQLTPEEAQALQADFPDEAFQPGAAGKDHLLYIEHAHLRDRLTQVLGLGQWAIIPRNRWAEEFEYYDKNTKSHQQASRVYVEAMLVVRGAFVGEAVGAMEYYPKNQSQNYGDAVEGAKTAAFRRCCKELSIGLQAWKKDWCEGWWARKRSKTPYTGSQGGKPSASVPASKPAASPQSTTAMPQNAPSAVVKPFPTAESLTKALVALQAAPNMDGRNLVHEYFVKAGAILPTETLEDLPLRFCPNTPGLIRSVGAAIADFEAGNEALLAFPPHPEPDDAGPKGVKAANGPPQGEKDEPWRAFPLGWGKHAGTQLQNLEKNYLFGLCMNYTVETEYNGKPKKPDTIAKDRLLREHLDSAMAHYGWKKDTKEAA